MTTLSPAAILAAVSAAFCPAPFTVVRRVGGFSGDETGAVVVTEATFDGSRWVEVRIGAASVVALRGAGPVKTKADKDARRAQLVTLRRIVEAALATLAREAA